MIWALVIFCLLLSFVLSGCESAVLAVTRVRVRHAAFERNDAVAKRLLPLIEERDATLASVTLVNHITNLAAFLIVTWRLVQWLGNQGYAVAFFLALPIFLVGLEVVPKKLFRRFPFRMLRHLTPLLVVVGWLRPVFRGLIRRTESLEGEVGKTAQLSQGRADLVDLANVLAERGQMETSAAQLIKRILSYRRLTAQDLMLPLNRSYALSPEMTTSAALILSRERACDWLPVMGPDGKIIGVFEAPFCPPNLPQDRLVRQHMRALDTVASGDKALHVLQRMRRRGRMVAIVSDAAHEAIGLVTEDDLLRPLFSDQ
jgi:CBS domain containing-hemolysin-like protein